MPATNTKPERRVRHSSALEIRKRDDGTRTLGGYAALFNVDAKIGGLYTESIKPGAFRESLKRKDDVRALWNHNTDVVLGRSKSGTLRLAEDDKGLRYEVDLPDTEAARALATAVERGDVDGSSFGFYTKEDRWFTKDGNEHRELVELELFDVSAVTFPAYEQTAGELSVRAREVYTTRPAKSVEDCDRELWLAEQD